MKSSPFAKVFLTSGIIFLGYLGYRWLFHSEEERVMKTMGTVEEGLEARNSSQVLSVISEDYLDNLENRRPHIRDLLVMFCRITRDVMVSIRKQSLKIDGDQAEGDFAVAVKVTVGEQPIEPLPEDGSEIIHIKLKKEGGEWKVTGAVFPPEAQQWIRRMPKF